MGLRVLLADESSTIKKVLQLALQEYGVEVKPVPVGIDVISVAKSFKPDIIFADVLLSKRSGYDVCSDVKSDTDLKSTPFVLMWSSFMEFDEKRATEAAPDRRLEKPFDAETLRKTVKDLVPRLKKSPISDFLAFPETPDSKIELKKDFLPHPNPPSHEPAILPEAPIRPADSLVKQSESLNPTNSLTFDSSRPKEKPEAPISPPSISPKATLESYSTYAPEDQWERMSLNSGNESGLENSKIIVATENSLDQGSSLLYQEVPLLKPFDVDQLASGIAKSTLSEAVNTKSLPGVTEAEIEQVVRSQIRDIVESIAWKILPDIAERIVREEIDNMMKAVEGQNRQ